MDEPDSKEKFQVELFCFPVQDKKSPRKEPTYKNEILTLCWYAWAPFMAVEEQRAVAQENGANDDCTKPETKL